MKWIFHTVEQEALEKVGGEKLKKKGALTLIGCGWTGGCAADKGNSGGVGDVLSLRFIRGRRNAITASS